MRKLALYFHAALVLAALANASGHVFLGWQTPSWIAALLWLMAALQAFKTWLEIRNG